VSPRSWRLRIQDILQSLKDIQIFVSDQTLETFLSDKKTYFAVIRSLEIIGEAANHVPDGIKLKYPAIPRRKMKDLRNILSHQYFGVDNEMIWTTVHDNLFPLRSNS
jgi:uncharacterized protein with HEPN domain